MNRLLLYTTLLCCIMVNSFAPAEIGCMEKSLRLKEFFDPKAYHYVDGGDGGPCHCPCAKYRAQCKPLRYGQCPICKHYQANPSLIVATKAVCDAAAKKLAETTSPVAYEGDQQLIKAWATRR
jgi:hypothetical protein